MIVFVTMLIRFLVELSRIKEMKGDEFRILVYAKKRWIRWAIHLLSCEVILYFSPHFSEYLIAVGHEDIASVWDKFIPGLAGYFGFDLLSFIFNYFNKKYKT